MKEISLETTIETYAGLLLFKDSLARMNECKTQLEAIAMEQSKRVLVQKEEIYQEALAFEKKETIRMQLIHLV